MARELSEGTILLGPLIGQLRKTEQEGIYRFVHSRVGAASNVKVYQNFFRRCEGAAWTSSVGCGFRAVSDITPLESGKGFDVLIQPTLPKWRGAA